MYDALQVSQLPIVSDIEDRVEALLLHAGKLYVGCNNGSLHIYSLNLDDEPATASLDKTVRQFSPHPIDQLGVVKQTNSIVSLSNGTIHLHDLHSLQQQTALGSSSATKGQAALFAVETSVQLPLQTESTLTGSSKHSNHPTVKTGPDRNKQPLLKKAIHAPNLVSSLAVACRRRLVLFTWCNEQWQAPQELQLPHQIRSLAFTTPSSIVVGFSTKDYGIITLSKRNVSLSTSTASSPISVPMVPALESVFQLEVPHGALAPTSSNASSLGAISGLGGLAAKTGGYVGLTTKVDRNFVVKVQNEEFSALRDNICVFCNVSSRPSWSKRFVECSTAPDEVVTVWPYLLSVLPPTPHGRAESISAKLPSIEVHLVPQRRLVQKLNMPPLPADRRPASIVDMPPPQPSQLVKLLTASENGKAPLVILVEPTLNAPQNNLSTPPAHRRSEIYLIRLMPLLQQVDQVISHGDYEMAMSLLSSSAHSERQGDFSARRKQLESLNALLLFRDQRKISEAMTRFIDLNINPSKVIALYPVSLSGKLATEEDEIEGVWGGRTKADIVRQRDEEGTNSAQNPHQGPVPLEEIAQNLSSVDRKASVVTWGASPSKTKAYPKDDDTASIRSRQSGRGGKPQALSTEQDINDVLSQKSSVDVLVMYLTDRRQHIAQALANLSLRERPSPSSPMPESPSSSPVDLFRLPDAALSTYTPSQLQRTAQVVETTLFRCYLQVKQVMLGPLCRIENWCEVEEVEELLLEAKKYTELLDLYNGKHMHDKAVRLLKRMVEEADGATLERNLAITVAYLQKLGPKYLELIFEASKWISEIDTDYGLQLFTADREEVESLPRYAVSMHLSRTAPASVYMKYLEYIIHRLHEDGADFHDKLIELYLAEVIDAMEGDDIKQNPLYQKLLLFLETSHRYRPDRLLGRVPDDSLFEIRANLLGRMEQHEAALTIYVHKLRDNQKAEDYCKRFYSFGTPSSRDIYITLLKVYLRPVGETKSHNRLSQQSSVLQIDAEYLRPVLHLLKHYGTKMNTSSALELLPPLLTVQELQDFLTTAVRQSASRSRNVQVHSRLRRARMDQVERTAMALRSQRVKVTDSRYCPSCHKRLGNSAIAVHAPNGDVTHYNCRDKWVAA